MRTLTLFMALSLLLIAGPLRADSPLTSTPFWQAYKDLPEVMHASKQNGQIDRKTIDFILNGEVGVDCRMAAINALSWSTAGQDNAAKLLEAIRTHHKVKNLDDLKGDGAAEILALYAYTKSMDNYFDVKEALAIATKAQRMEPGDFSIDLIRSLIMAQDVMDHDWCKVYTSMNHLKEMDRGEFREDAFRIIFEYIDLYKETC